VEMRFRLFDGLMTSASPPVGWLPSRVEELRDEGMAKSFASSAHNDQIEFITSQEEFGVWLERISESRVIHFVLVDECVIHVHANTNGIAEGFGGIEISPSPHECCEGRQRW
jgi:hypothetical protein